MIECYADRFAVVGGRRYMIGHPCDWAVSVCTPKDEGSVEAVPLDSELMEELLPGLQVASLWLIFSQVPYRRLCCLLDVDMVVRHHHLQRAPVSVVG